MNSLIGQNIALARKRKGLTQEQLSMHVCVTREAIAKYETGERTIPKDILIGIINQLDDVELYIASWRAVTGSVSIPLMDGINIDTHSTSMVCLVKKETSEALKQVENMTWYLPSEKRDKEEVERMIAELLDAASSMMNLVVSLCKEHGLSMRVVFRKWQESLRMRGFKQ
jgi:transcriptional regulator with XRE-family HTH domain